MEGLKERTAPLRERTNALKTDLTKADREKAGVSASLKQYVACAVWCGVEKCVCLHASYACASE